MDYDFAIIGGGSAGYAAARTAVGLGLKTVVVEGGREMGGLCILRGCMPSKTLIESANRYLTLRRAKEFGLRADKIEFKGEEIIARKRKLIGGFADYRREQLESGKFELIRARASFTDPHTLQLEWPGELTRTLTAKTFLISTGSEVSWPEVEGLRAAKPMTSDEFLESSRVPKSAIVLGSGPVALEAAHYWDALGVKVTIIQRGPQLLTGMDRDVADVMAAAFRKRGTQIFTDTKLLRCGQANGAKFVEFEHAGKTQRLEAEEILNSLGRRPAVGTLALEKAEVKLRPPQVQIQPTQQTNQPHIFAAGDVCGPHEIVHIAINQGEIAARNAAKVIRKQMDLEQTDFRLKLFVVFTEPQVAVVGLTESEATAKGLPFRAANYPFNDHGKSEVMGETEGFVKLLAHAETGEILGGAAVGPHASDLIHEVVVAMAFRSTAAQFAAIPHYHPTLAEIWTYPAEELAESA